MSGRRARIDLVALERSLSPRWMRDALRIEHDDLEFFIEHGEDPRPAKSICSRCAVRAECLDYALQHHIDDGIWGGTSGRERANLRRTTTTPPDSHINATRP